MSTVTDVEPAIVQESNQTLLNFDHGERGAVAYVRETIHFLIAAAVAK